MHRAAHAFGTLSLALFALKDDSVKEPTVFATNADTQGTVIVMRKSSSPSQ